MSEPLGITITPAKIGFFLSLTAVVGVFWPALTWYSQRQVDEALQNVRILRTEETLTEFRGEVKDLTTSLGVLSTKVSELNITIQDNNGSRRSELRTPTLGLPPKDFAQALNEEKPIGQ